MYLPSSAQIAVVLSAEKFEGASGDYQNINSQHNPLWVGSKPLTVSSFLTAHSTNDGFAVNRNNSFISFSRIKLTAGFGKEEHNKPEARKLKKTYKKFPITFFWSENYEPAIFLDSIPSDYEETKTSKATLKNLNFTSSENRIKILRKTQSSFSHGYTTSLNSSTSSF